MTDVATVFQALVGYDPEDGQTQLAIDYNATDYGDNYTQFLKIDGLEVQLPTAALFACKLNFSALDC